MSRWARREEAAPPKSERLAAAFDLLGQRPPATTGLEAYCQLSKALNEIEDSVWGTEDWAPPRVFELGQVTDRMYTVSPDSFFAVDGYRGVILLLSTKELIFIGRYGAIEVQRKMAEQAAREVPFCSRRSQVMFQKADHEGNGVWHPKNRG